jgi:lycopene cyclase domain-containing protein
MDSLKEIKKVSQKQTLSPNNHPTFYFQNSGLTKFAWIALLLGLVLLLLQWSLDTVKSDNLIYEVSTWTKWSFLESRWTYFYLHLFTVIPVLALSFDKNVHYYKKWKHLLPAIIPVAVFFIIWDVVFTARGVWGFNEEYFSGWLIFGLPVEEWLFFFTVPFACVFIYECLNYYIKKDLLAKAEPFITPILIVVFFIVGFLHFRHTYTATTFLLSGSFLLYHYLAEPAGQRSRFYLAYLVVWIPFVLVNGVLTGGFTEAPVVVYNPEEYLGIRVGSVPVDDSIYNFLMLLGIVTLFERFRG